MAPISVRQLRSEMNSRVTDSIIAFNSDVRPLDHHFEGHRNLDGTQTLYTGHRRNDPERHAKKGFAYWSKQDVSLQRSGHHCQSVRCNTNRSHSNAPGCWPRRHTWHSEELAGVFSKTPCSSRLRLRQHQKSCVWSNDPNIYVSRMDTYKLGELQMRKLSWWLREERERQRRKEGRRNGGHQARIDAGKAMKAAEGATRSLGAI